MLRISAAGRPPTLYLITFQPDGAAVASSADGTPGQQSRSVGTCWRPQVFLQTLYVFNFDPSRALTTVLKIRINAQMSPDGQTVKRTTELVIMDPAGRVLNTIAGGTMTPTFRPAPHLQCPRDHWPLCDYSRVTTFLATSTPDRLTGQNLHAGRCNFLRVGFDRESMQLPVVHCAHRNPDRPVRYCERYGR